MKKWTKGAYLVDSRHIVFADEGRAPLQRFSEEDIARARENTIAYGIFKSHNVSGNMERLMIKFDALVGQDMTYMGVLETAIASGVKEFPIPFVLSSCHNALCYNDGTSNEDDHLFAMGAAKKYGAVFLPTHQPGRRQPYPLRRAGHAGHRRRRRRADQAAAGPHL